MKANFLRERAKDFIEKEGKMNAQHLERKKMQAQEMQEQFCAQSKDG